MTITRFADDADTIKLLLSPFKEHEELIRVRFLMVLNDAYSTGYEDGVSNAWDGKVHEFNVLAMRLDAFTILGILVGEVPYPVVNQIEDMIAEKYSAGYQQGQEDC